VGKRNSHISYYQTDCSGGHAVSRLKMAACGDAPTLTLIDFLCKISGRLILTDFRKAAKRQ